MSLRTKLFLVLGGLFAGVAAMTAFAALRFRAIGYEIERILQENYRSVIAAEDMKEALERQDSWLNFARAARVDEARREIGRYRDRFERALSVEKNNITLPGEREAAAEIDAGFRAYIAESDAFLDLPSAEGRESAYFATLLPRFERLKDVCDRVLEMNHRAMLAADRAARTGAEEARQILRPPLERPVEPRSTPGRLPREYGYALFGGKVTRIDLPDELAVVQQRQAVVAELPLRRRRVRLPAILEPEHLQQLRPIDDQRVQRWQN